MNTENEISSYSAQPVSSDFTNVPLDPDQPKRKKVPRRLIHFSDGVLEEYSTDEEDEAPPLPPPVDPKTLTWGPWFWFYISTAAFKTLGDMADSCGEKLAWFFGITTPKYQSAIDEFYRLKSEEEKELEYEQRAREKLQDLSSIDVKVIDQHRDKGSGDSPTEKF